jgi:hypothetical protein
LVGYYSSFAWGLAQASGKASRPAESVAAADGASLPVDQPSSLGCSDEDMEPTVEASDD